MKYPLTEAAKAAAKEIATFWENDELPQRFGITIYRGDDKEIPHIFIAPDNFDVPDLATWWELSKFNLIEIDYGEDIWDVLLLQELRNAVATDFEVSPYFFSMNAVGNIIVNSTTGPVQGTGYNTGVIHQSVEQLADFMSSTLGQNMLAEQEALRGAIEEFRSSVSNEDQQSKLGKVISELGNCLQHGANTATIVSAISAAAPFLQKLIGV